MAITLDGTNGVTTPDLTVDTDTLTVDATNNRVGIGTTSPAGTLDVVTGTYRGYFDDAGGSLFRLNGVNAANSSYEPLGINGSVLVFQTGATERMRVDSSGNVGINTSSPTQKLDVDGAVRCDYVVFGDTSSVLYESAADNVNMRIGADGPYLEFRDAGGAVAEVGNVSGSLALTASGTERMRITSGGQVLVGETSVYSSGGIGTAALQFGGKAGVRAGAVSNQDTTAALTAIGFSNPNGDCGTIFTSGTSTTYATTSDYRLKENNTPITNATERVKQLKPIRFNFIKDPDTTVDGFLAHEVAEVVPEAVAGEKDATAEVNIYDEDNNVIGTETKIVSQGIDQAKLVPLLVATIQELEARITALEAANGS